MSVIISAVCVSVSYWNNGWASSFTDNYQLSTYLHIQNVAMGEYSVMVGYRDGILMPAPSFSHTYRVGNVYDEFDAR